MSSIEHVSMFQDATTDLPGPLAEGQLKSLLLEDYHKGADCFSSDLCLQIIVSFIFSLKCKRTSEDYTNLICYIIAILSSNTGP